MFLCFNYTFCHGQFSEVEETSTSKKFFVGGSFNFDKSENRDSPIFFNDILIIVGSVGNGVSENSAYSFNPSIGYQVNKNWILGLDLFLNNRKSERGDFSDILQVQESSSNSFGVYARYIFNPEHKFQVYANPYFRTTNEEGSFTFSSSTGNDTSVLESSSNNLGLSLGVQYELASWVRATTNVGGLYYTSGSTRNTGFNNSNLEVESDFNSYGFNLRASSIFIGVEFLF